VNSVTDWAEEETNWFETKEASEREVAMGKEGKCGPAECKRPNGNCYACLVSAEIAVW
jgi:hypothetical protein